MSLKVGCRSFGTGWAGLWSFDVHRFHSYYILLLVSHGYMLLSFITGAWAVCHVTLRWVFWHPTTIWILYVQQRSLRPGANGSRHCVLLVVRQAWRVCSDNKHDWQGHGETPNPFYPEWHHHGARDDRWLQQEHGRCRPSRPVPGVLRQASWEEVVEVHSVQPLKLRDGQLLQPEVSGKQATTEQPAGVVTAQLQDGRDAPDVQQLFVAQASIRRIHPWSCACLKEAHHTRTRPCPL